MKKHMYLRILWPYILEIIMLGFSDYESSNPLNGIRVDPLIILFFIMPVPFLLSFILFIKNYNRCSKSQKIIFIIIDILALLLLIVSIYIYHGFIAHPFPIL